MSVTKLTAAQKAAIVLLSLGDDISADVFRAMQPAEIRTLSNTISRLGNLETEEINAVLREFESVINEPEVSLVGNYEIAKNLLDRAFEGEAADIINQVSLQKEPTIDCLDLVEARTLSAFLVEEHPQTIALIMAHLDPAKFSETLNLMPQHMHSDLLRRIVNLDYPSADVIHDLNKILNAELRMTPRRDRSFGGAEHVARALNSMPRSLQSNVLKDLEAQSPAIAHQIIDLMFTFEDLIKIDGRGIQELLKIIDSQQWILALRLASDSLKEHVFKNISERRKDIILEDIQDMGSARMEDIKAAQAEIVKAARLLELEGKITIYHNPYEHVA